MEVEGEMAFPIIYQEEDNGDLLKQGKANCIRSIFVHIC